MSDPLSLVPFAVAARDGVVDGWPVRQLVSAGVGLLRGSAPLVRSLAGRRSAILLPPGPLMLTALAASDGRGSVLLEPGIEWPHDLAVSAKVGAVFTTATLQGLVPAGIPRVLLDEVPHRARYVDGDREANIDLALHVGVSLEGDPDVSGSNEEVLLVRDLTKRGEAATFTHRALLVRARATIADVGLVASDHTFVLRDAGDAVTLASGELAALLAGGRVTTGNPHDAAGILERIEQFDVSVVVARATVFEALLACVSARGTRLEAPSLRHLVCVGDQLPDAAHTRWADVTGTAARWIDVPDA